MPRNGSGTYTLSQAPFVAGTTISSAAVNSDFSDIASALTASLPRDGQVGMSGALKHPDGSVALPAMSFNNEDNTGFYRVGAGQLGISILGVQVGIFSATGFSGSSIPVGAIMDYGGWNGAPVPTKWLLCSGQNVSRFTYADLFAALGTTHGAGDGSNTFGIPDLRGRLTTGRDAGTGRIAAVYYGSDPNNVGAVGGSQVNSLVTAHLPAYTPSGGVGISDPGHNHTVNQITFWRVDGPVAVGVGGGGAFGSAGPTTLSLQNGTTGISAGFTGNAQGGGSAAFGILPPSLIVHKIIYAGV